MDSKRREQIKKLLSIRDRNGSTAEHWAAGGGHLDCVVYLLDMRDFIASGASEPTNISTSEGNVAPQNTETLSTNYANKKIRRRRDGKTSLHYAARNGHIDIIDLLLSRQRQEEKEDAPLHVDISSGDGTTPLHMACYGGHRRAVQHLIEIHSANIHACNEWECSSAHWAAMSLGADGAEKVIELCIYLKQRGANFVQRQKQGHTPLHKAASRKNRHVIEWLATSSLFSEEEKKAMGAKDVGGNCPSDVWLSVGGEEEFGLWMKEKWNW
jgi:ankyrin repeat protein